MATELKRTEYLNAAQVRARFAGVSRMWLHRRMRDSNFPAPVRFGGKNRFWRLSDIAEWERQMIINGTKR